jgi:cytochrome c peroxidase
MMRVVSSAVAGLMLLQGVAWGVPGPTIPPPTLFPLNQIAVPEPPNLFQFVKNRPAAIKLGKALFWDMQAGSDGIQACASCHFAAGADNRLKNTANPGFDNIFKVRGPNETFQSTDFPFLERLDPDTQSLILRDSNDIVGSQGVRFTDFQSIVPGSAVDNGTLHPDNIFNVNGNNTRRVTGRQAPSVINAIFNFNNFWDGRAHFEFNGVNPFGTLDPIAGVWFNNNGTLVKQAIAMQFGSLASQATGPPLNETEMSYLGRTFPQLGRKMLSLTPLGRQLVHPDDSELGTLSRATLHPDGSITGSKGLSTSYTQMIKDAFLDKFWNSTQLTTDGYTQMEANFSLFWGLAIQLYEATLVSDQTPFDQFLGGDQTALTAQQKDGFNLFFGAAGCGGCHFSTELTSASVRNSGFLTNASHALIEPMTVGSGQQIIYDNGFNNTAVRPTTEDIARGADSPFPNPLNNSLPFPLSFSALAELQALNKLGFNASLFALGSPLTPILPPSIPANFPVANNGNFKVPGLRNVELTAPYFHNGGVMTLKDVVEFYTRGGDFRLQNQNDVDVLIADIGPLQHDPVKQAAVVAFMLSFTDERVRNEAAPFDHPELLIPNGDPEVLIRLSAKNLNGVAAPTLPTVTLNPVTTPTGQTSQLIGGTKEFGAAIQVKVNNGQALPADTATDTTWSTTVTGLVSGSNAITVTATDVAGGVTTLTADISVNVPAFTITASSAPNGSIAQAGVTTVPSGASQTYTVTPNPGFAVAALVVDGTMLPGATSYTFNNVTADHYINAYFEPSAFTVTAAADANGSISPAGAAAVTPGSNQTYTITPNPGFMVAALVVDGTQLPGATTHTFTNLAASHYINAYFAPIPASSTITAAAGPDGSISPTGATTVTGGASQTYTITPNAGFTVTALVVDGTLLPGATSYTFNNVAADHYINAYFAPLSTVTINSAAAPNGTISPAGAATVISGASQTYTITPDPGFTVTALVVDGALLPGATSYTFTGVTAPHYINAYFGP